MFITIEELAVVFRYGEMITKGFRIIDLETVEAGESLHFDNLGRPSACPVVADAEIENQEVGASVLVSDPVCRGNSAFRPFFEGGFQDKIDDIFTCLRQQGGEGCGYEYGGFGQPEFDGSRVATIEVGQEIVI